MRSICIKKHIISLVILCEIIFSSSLAYAAPSQTNMQEAKEYPISVAAKYSDSLYINRIKSHTYLTKEDKRMPIPLKYYYDINKKVLFLGEDSNLYCMDKESAQTKLILKDIKAAVSAGPNENLAYALNTKGELFRIAIDPMKTEIIKNDVIILYSAWSDWVVYQTANKKWWKHDLKNSEVQVTHKSPDASPFIPNMKTDSLFDKHEVLGPWSMNITYYHDLIGRHGGENRYYDYSVYSWQYIDGINGPQDFYSMMSETGCCKIIGADENNLYVALFSTPIAPMRGTGSMSDAISKEPRIDILQIKSTGKETLIYSENYTDKVKWPHFYWESNRIWRSFEGKSTIAWIPPKNDLPPTIYSPQNTLDSSGKWVPSLVKENTLYKVGAKSNADQMVSSYEGNGIWIYSKGLINAVYLDGDALMLLRNGKRSIIKEKTTTMDWEKSFSLNGWIYLSTDGFFLRFQVDDPTFIQRMDTNPTAPIFEAEDIEQLRTAKKFWYELGYIYYIEEASTSLYRILPNGKEKQKILDGCIDAAFFENKIFCITAKGVFALSPTGSSKSLLLKKEFGLVAFDDNKSYIDMIKSSGGRIIFSLQESVPDPESDFNYNYKQEIHSMTLKYKNDVILPAASNYSIIDSSYYYRDIEGQIWHIGVDGKGKELLY